MYHAGGRIPTAAEIASALPGGRVRKRGQVEFQDPWHPKKGKWPCALWLKADDPHDPFRVSSLNPKHDTIQLKDKVRELVPGLGPFTPRRKDKGNGKAHRPAGGPVVGEPSKDGRNGGGRGASSGSAQVAGQASRLYLLPFDAIKLGTKRRDLIQGLIPRVGLTVIWGPPKCGKSFLGFDMAMHVALGWDYRGRRVQ